ncbi:hypothetical protein [Olleya sp. R77988]|uniref:hypothetical protein n=1 Tax=Olleya sp. R77988 TaxID=3093875 RepID=UPI0037CC408A
MNILKSITEYFKKKENNEPTGIAPEGICPNCWGKQEWEGEFYRLKKGTTKQKRDETYNNFINKIVETNIDGIVINKETLVCETCQVSYKNKP